jgi:hypothetical protein
LGSLFQAQHDLAFQMIYLFNGVTGTIFAFLLYRTELIPRWIAVLGLIGIRCCSWEPSWTCSI